MKIPSRCYPKHLNSGDLFIHLLHFFPFNFRFGKRQNDRLKDVSFFDQIQCLWSLPCEVSTNMAFAATTNKPMRNLNKAGQQECPKIIWTQI